MKMTNWEKANLLTKDKYKYFFDEELGLITDINITISSVYDENNNRINNGIYSNMDLSTHTESKIYVYIVDLSSLSLTDIFKMKLYTMKKGYNYGLISTIPILNVIEIGKASFELTLQFCLYNDNKCVRRNVIVSSRDELQKIVILATNEEV